MSGKKNQGLCLANTFSICQSFYLCILLYAFLERNAISKIVHGSHHISQSFPSISWNLWNYYLIGIKSWVETETTEETIILVNNQ